MWDDYFRFALEGITHRKVRSWLTMLGVFIGIMAVVTLISLGQGLQKYIDLQFEKIGGDRIIITPGGGDFTSGAPGGSLTSAKLHDGDLDIVQKTRGVDVALGLVMQSTRVEYNKKSSFLTLVGIPTESQYLQFLKDFEYAEVGKGTYLKEGDRYKAIVGPETGKDIYGKELDVGGKVLLEGIEFTVVGLSEDTGNPAINRRIIIPQEVAQELFNKTDDYAMFGVKVQKGFEPSEVADRIEERLRKHRDVKEGEEDFSVQTFENIIASFRIILNLLTVVLSGIAFISLIVGGIGIMTTMYTSVLERTRQVGIMKSIGARNNDILIIFIAESGLLGLMGGVVGILFGLLASFAGEIIIRLYGITEYSLYAGPDLIIGALLFSVIVGCVSGYLPAVRASKMSPVDALRYR
jgi:putative ABC transport system permease protein